MPFEDPPLAERWMGANLEYLYVCKDCDVRWRAATATSPCWFCGKEHKRL